MPELPEVEIIKKSLQKNVLFKKIDNVLIKNRNLRFKIQRNLKKFLIGKKIINISRKSKYLIFHFKEDYFLIIHFGMSGTLHLIKNNCIHQSNLSFYKSQTLPKKHNHVELIFSNFKIVYNDPRRFGFFKFLFSYDQLKLFFKKVGPEALDSKFNFGYLKKKLQSKEKNIKNILLDQKFVSGLGNIYVNEILYYSRINPYTKGKYINDYKKKKIIKYSKEVLRKAIKRGGSTIRDFKNAKGNIGSFQNEFKVYNRVKKNCLREECNGKIERVVISSRSTFLCKYCQK
tara:strand:- start:39 stop:899 length:861 start_codon:yes stop_codon:yes gene_type:complete